MSAVRKILLLDQKDAPLSSDSFIRWILFFLGGYRRLIFGFLAFRLVRYALMALLPLAVGLVINAFETKVLFDRPLYYGGLLSAYLFVYTLLLAANVFFLRESNTYEKIARSMTLFSIRHVNKLPLDWHERQGSGSKLQRIMTARKNFIDMGRTFRWTIVPLVGSVFGIAISVVTLDVPFVFFFLYPAFILSYVAVSWIVGRKVVALYDTFNQTYEKLLANVYEFVSAIRTVKSFALNDHIDGRAEILESHGQQAIEDVYYRTFLRWFIINMVGAAWIILFAGLGFWGVYQGWLSSGAYAATFFLAVQVWRALEDISIAQDALYEQYNGIMRLTQTLKEQAPALDIQPLQRLPEWQSLALKSVSFAYQADSAQGLSDISLTVRRGEKIAFVGASGAGKSTLAKLLMKQMLPTSGSILLDDIDLIHVPSFEWLAKIGLVPQDVELFNLSIRDNILIDRENIEGHLYDDALRQAALFDFVQTLPEKDATMIGERGIKLSGGQRQRLGIARALVRKADILIFDEATSSLDSLSEQQIQQSIENSFAGHTVFLIAHRLSTVRKADRIYVLDNGRIVEEGSFDALVAQHGLFAKLWDIQSRESTKKAA